MASTTSLEPEVWTIEAIENGEKVLAWLTYPFIAFIGPILMVIFLGFLIIRYNRTLNRLYLFLFPWFAVLSALLIMLPVLYIAHYGLGPKVHGYTIGLPPVLPGSCAAYPEKLRSNDPWPCVVDWITACPASETLDRGISPELCKTLDSYNRPLFVLIGSALFGLSFIQWIPRVRCYRCEHFMTVKDLSMQSVLNGDRTAIVRRPCCSEGCATLHLSHGKDLEKGEGGGEDDEAGKEDCNHGVDAEERRKEMDQDPLACLIQSALLMLGGSYT